MLASQFLHLYIIQIIRYLSTSSNRGVKSQIANRKWSPGIEVSTRYGVKPFLRNGERVKRRQGETVASQMKKLHFNELSTDFLIHSSQYLDIFDETFGS